MNIFNAQSAITSVEIISQIAANNISSGIVERSFGQELQENGPYESMDSFEIVDSNRSSKAIFQELVFLATNLQVLGGIAVSTVTYNNSTYRVGSKEGMAIERAINDSDAVRGLTPDWDIFPVFEQTAQTRFTRNIDRSRFLKLLAGFNG